MQIAIYMSEAFQLHCCSTKHSDHLDTSGKNAHLTLDLCVQLRALHKKANKVEKMKNKKGGHKMWQEVHELGALIGYSI